MPILIKAKEFEAEVLRAKMPVLVDFFGERCMPCKLLHPILIELGEAYAGRMKICMFNTDSERGETRGEFEAKYRTIAAYEVMSLPTMLLFVAGEPRRTLVGLHTREELIQILEEEGVTQESDQESGDREQESDQESGDREQESGEDGQESGDRIQESGEDDQGSGVRGQEAGEDEVVEQQG